MQYLGGKHKIARHIVPFMEMFYRRDHVTWVEPFMGACNTLALASGPRIGNDIDPDLVALFEAMQKGYEPPMTVTEDEYNLVKMNPTNFDPELCGFMAFGCSFGGKKWGGFARDRDGKNYAAVARRSLERKLARLTDVKFSCGSYFDLMIPPHSFIYCDPPYQGTQGYGVSFDHDVFWAWCRDQSSRGHTVLISEYSAPDDFETVTTSTQITTLDKSHLHARESIFKWSGSE